MHDLRKFSRLLPILLTAGVGCAGANTLGRVTPDMPAHLDAAPPPSRDDRPIVLASDPPLPGMSSRGWSALTEEDDEPPSGYVIASADDAARLAVENDRELRARIADVAVSAGLGRAEGRAPNPELEVELMPERESRVEVSLVLDLGGTILAPVRARAARASVEAERRILASDVVTTAFLARAAFYEASATRAREAVGMRALDALAAERDAVEALYASGNATALELAARVGAYERARVEVAALSLDARVARERLVRRLGLHGARADVSVPQLPEAPTTVPDLSDLERRALEASHELAASRARLESLDRRSRLATAEARMPHLELDAHLLVGRDGDIPIGAQDASIGVGAGVTVGVPLFDRGVGDRAAAHAAVDAEFARYDGAALRVRSEAREAAARLVSADARVRHFDTVVRTLARRALDETRRQYDAMQVDVFRLVSAHREVLAIELAYVEALRELLTAHAAVRALLDGGRVGSDGAGDSAMTLATGGSPDEGDH